MKDSVGRHIGKLNGYLQILKIKNLPNEVIIFLRDDMIELDKLLCQAYNDKFITSEWVELEHLLKKVHYQASNYLKKDFKDEI